MSPSAATRREPVFFEADDYRLYRRLIATAALSARTAVWAYWLMPNHVHLPIMPTWRDAGGRRRVAGDLCQSAPALHRAINARFRWTGHLFQGRFGAVVMDEPHLLAAARYIALNPAVAGLVSRAEDWPWSSTRAQLAGEDDELTAAAPLRADPRFCRPSRHADRRGDDHPDRAGPHHRPPAWEAGMDRDARAPARPPFGTPQTRPKAATGAGHRAASSAAMM